MRELHDKVDKLEHEIVELRADIKDLVSAWNTAQGVTVFVKWLGSLSIGATILYNVLTHGWPSK